MNNLRIIAAAVVSVAALAGCSSTLNTTPPGPSQSAAGGAGLSAEAKRDLGQHYTDTLQRLYDTTPGSRELVAKAAGVLIFPSAVSAGFVVGGEFGNGELHVGNRLAGYYRTASGSFGLQAGAQSRALVFLFMTRDALAKFEDSKGWSFGADASVAVLKVGANGQIDINAAGSSPIVAFVMTNAGLMANLTLEGTKITRIE